MKISFRYDYFTYYPKFLEGYFDVLYSDLDKLCVTYREYNRFKDCYQDTNKRSCFFIDKTTEHKPDAGSRIFSYGDLDSYDWKDTEYLIPIKKFVEDLTGYEYDFCLAHVYDSGRSSIGWHNDKEALDSPVCSVSFMEFPDEYRRFRIKNIETKEVTNFDLYDGDIFLMHGPGRDPFLNKYLQGCQRVFVHEVPKTSRKVCKRINLTFRKLNR